MNQGHRLSQQAGQELNLADHPDPVESEPSDKARVWVHHRTGQPTEGAVSATWWRIAIQIRLLPSTRAGRYVLRLSWLLGALGVSAAAWGAVVMERLPAAFFVPTPLLIPVLVLAARALVTRVRR